MEKLLFAIYKDDSKSLQHRIVLRKSKKALEDELRDEGFIPKVTFSLKDEEKILADEYYNVSVSDAYITYFKDHKADWDAAK